MQSFITLSLTVPENTRFTKSVRETRLGSQKKPSAQCEMKDYLIYHLHRFKKQEYISFLKHTYVLI